MGILRSLTDEEKADVEARLELLEKRLGERSDSVIARSVTGLLLTYPNARPTGEEAEILVAAFVMALSDLPPWAVTEAATRWMRGDVPDGINTGFAPSAGDLHKLAREIVMPFWLEQQKLRDMLKAEVVDRTPLKSRPRISQNMPLLESKAARSALEARCAELGIDPAEIDKLPAGKPRETVDDWKPASQSLPRKETEVV